MNNLSREKKKKIGTEKKNYFEFFLFIFFGEQSKRTGRKFITQS
jgi:hypothetical protein